MNGLLRALAWFVVIGGALCAIGYYTYADVWVVPTDDPRLLVSVEPTLRGGDVILVERHGVPAIGSLVRCTDPDESRRWVVGRLIGANGAQVHLSNQSFSTLGSRPTSSSQCDPETLVNPATGEEVPLVCRNEDFAGTSYQALSRSPAEGAVGTESEVKVPPGRSFLLSDNRYLHLDSRDYGSLPQTSCHHIVFRLWGAAGFTDSTRRLNLVW